MTRTELVNLDAGAECVPGMYQHLADSTDTAETRDRVEGEGCFLENRTTDKFGQRTRRHVDASIPLGLVFLLLRLALILNHIPD